MFIYLSKKIAIANNNIKLKCVKWSLNHDWIAVGGEENLLKILKLDSGRNKNIGNVGNISLSQTLEGHSGQVQIVVWNEEYQKLTSSDDSGLIIVWILYKGTWYEEMINNRNKSIVKSISWNPTGQKICIVYEDGVVIVGSVDGNRIWGKELKKLGLVCVQWSPDSKHILFGIRNGEFHLYDDEGVFSMKIKIQCLPTTQLIIQLAATDWYNGKNGYFCENCPVLAIVYQSGHIQLMRNQYDDNPIILDTNMYIVKCQWNHDGSMLAIIGTTVLIGDNKETNIVQFYSPFGEHIRTLKLPGSSVSDCSWENKSLKIALAIDSFLYFANIRLNYKWCFFCQTVVFAQRNHNTFETIISFWDTKNNECHQKTVKSLLSLAAYKNHCVLATEADNFSTQYMLMVCNNLTTIIDCKCMDMKPMWVTMNATHIFAASEENFIMWHYITPKSRSSVKLGLKNKKERLYHVDDTPSGVAEVIQDLADKNFEESAKTQPTKDPICCITCSDKILLIGRKSGTIQKYTLPQVALVQRFLANKVHSMAINCDSTTVSIIDCTGLLSFITLHKDNHNNYSTNKKEINQTERRDVWDMKWASDDPHYLAIMEKSRMYVLKDELPEEPINSSAYIADFQNLEIKGVLLDEIVSSADQLSHDYIVNFETKSLRDTRELLEKVGLSEATSFIEKNPHPRLWKLLAEASIQKLDLTVAEMAYVRRSDYAGIQFIKKLSNVQDNELKKALIATYFNNFDEAEKLYLKLDRRDLAIRLREKLGDWFKVIELMKSGSVTSDSQLMKAWNNIGDYFLDRTNWETAKKYFIKAENYEKLITCYNYLEDYEALESCISKLPEEDPLLEKIGEIFLNIGMCPQSVEAYLKFGSYEYAVKACIKLNQWNKAFELASSNAVNIPVYQQFEEYVQQLLEKELVVNAARLYSSAGKYLESANLLFEIAENKKLKLSPISLKKIYVLSALLVENYIKTNKNTGLKSMENAVFVDSDIVDSLRNLKIIDDPWHYAEAYHTLMLSQFHLLTGNTESALRLSIRLRLYTDILLAEQIYSIIAVCAISCSALEIASKAFTELESLETEYTKEYENMALHLFSKYDPKTNSDKRVKCTKCSSLNSIWDIQCSRCNFQSIICMSSGALIDNMADAWQCNTCKHFTLYNQIMQRNTCPLCHFQVKLR